MKRPELPSVSPDARFRDKSPKGGFTLVEVLLALAMAAIGFGVVLHSLGRQMTVVSGAIDRHQMLMYASQALETSLSSGTIPDDEVEPQKEPIGAFGASEDEEQVEAARFLYRVEASPVTADPRVEQVAVTVEGERGLVRLAAYRIRVRREE